MVRFVATFLLMLLLPFGWADDLYQTSQNSDPTDDCFFGDNDQSLPCDFQEVAPEGVADSFLPGKSILPVRPAWAIMGTVLPQDSTSAALGGTALLYALRSLRC